MCCKYALRQPLPVCGIDSTGTENMAASTQDSRRALPKHNHCNVCINKKDEELASLLRDIIKPSITELTKEVRTNILCTVEGCGKILPNTPALNMHLVKSHRVKDGIVNPTVRKDMKGSPKLYCCPIEGCPRGPNRPFSQFSLVKQHFMKMHAEKKHKCDKCSNCYSTEWDLRRHAEDCGKTYCCTCGCPYASRAALLSHIYRTGHELPAEHRYPPGKKRKMEALLNSATKLRPNSQIFPVTKKEKEMTELCVPANEPSSTDSGCQSHCPPKNSQKPLLPKPEVALVNVPIMQFAHLPVILSAENGALRSVVLAVDSPGRLVSAVQFVPQSVGAVMPLLDTKTLGFRDPPSRVNPNPVSTGVQVNLDKLACGLPTGNDVRLGSKSTSANIQTDISYLTKGSTLASCGGGEAAVSSCAQTDISVGAQVLLPVSVETQTFPILSKVTSSIAAQTDNFSQTCVLSNNVTKETQTTASRSGTEDRRAMDQSITCSELFDNNSFGVSAEASLKERPFQTDTAAMPLVGSGSGLYDDKVSGAICFGGQTEMLQQSSVADNQTQTMMLFSDLENILSDSMAPSTMDSQGPLSDVTSSCDAGLSAEREQSGGIDFDFEEFLKAVHIQTQTEESELCSAAPLESLDIETQTDFRFFDNPTRNDTHVRAGHSSDLGLEMFDTQTQTDLDFFLDPGSHMSLGGFLKQSSFSISTESSDTETQTDFQLIIESDPQDGHVKLNSTETQTVTSSFDGLGGLFLTSNQTQTVMDDPLGADLAWNPMESHFSSVETQTCDKLFSLFQRTEKPNS
ncbi:hypothetical protein GJAV_G00232680 [Gymnothorax javanicus]|nr:hypothetical protein GJAV_G00232680 [Gymnothorax javanicus]